MPNLSEFKLALQQARERIEAAGRAGRLKDLTPQEAAELVADPFKEHLGWAEGSAELERLKSGFAAKLQDAAGGECADCDQP